MLPSLLLLLRVFGVEKKMAAKKRQHENDYEFCYFYV